MSSSLISTIKQAILTESPSNVNIHERSLLSLLLEYNNKGDAISWSDFRVHSYRGKSLVLARHVVHFLHCFVLGIICIIYEIYNVLHKLATGKWRGMRPSSGINIVIFSTTLILAAVTLCFILTILIKEVVVAPNNAHINEQGVVTIDQPCLETQSFFLLNAATFWTSTGISVSKGDVVYITASGSMYSDIGEMYKKADENATLFYPRSFFSPNGTQQELDKEDVKYCIYGRGSGDTADASFGSLLYQICKSSQGPVLHNGEREKAIKQIALGNKYGPFQNKTFHFTAQESGTLFLSFNDIYLDSETYRKIMEDTNSQTYKDLMSHPVELKNDAPKDPAIWLQDNIGEALVNIRIEKNICKSDIRWFKKPVVYFYREMGRVKTLWPWKSQFWETKLPLLIICIVGLFFIDVVISSILKKKTMINNDKLNNNNIGMKLTKEEFELLVMLYAASIDGNIHENECEIMLEKSSPANFKKIKKQFLEMSDVEILECIEVGKNTFATTEDAKAEILTSVSDIINADKRHTAIEEQLLRAVRKLLQ